MRYNEEFNSAFESVLNLIDDSYVDPLAIEEDVATEAMKKSDREKLPDSAFALPKKRKYPINDADSVKNGIKYFRFVPKDDQKECAKNLYTAAKKFGIDITITKGNPFEKYYPDVKVVPPTRKDKKDRVIPKDTDVTDVQDKMKDAKENFGVGPGIDFTQSAAISTSIMTQGNAAAVDYKEAEKALNDSGVTWKYVIPLKSKFAISKYFMKYLKYGGIPADLQICFVKYNGGTPNPQCFTLGKENYKVFGNLLSLNKDDEDSVYKFTSVAKRKKIIPFGITPNGDLLCISKGKIVYYDHENDSIIPICNTFTEFLNSLYA